MWRVEKLSFDSEVLLVSNLKYNEYLYIEENFLGYEKSLESKKHPNLSNLSKKKYHWYIKCSDECIY